MRECSYIVQCYGHTKIKNDLYLVLKGSPYGDFVNILDEPSIQEYLVTAAGFGLMVRWMSEIAGALAYMHRMFVRHGDIKPRNVLVLDGLHVKLADLGFSKKATNNVIALSNEVPVSISTNVVGQVGGDETSNDETSLSVIDSITADMSRMGGTRGYMAPEQMSGMLPTLASDIFSFAITCLYLLNRGPAQNSTCFQTIFKRTKSLCIDLYGSDICMDVFHLLERCLSLTPKERPTAIDCVETFKTCIVCNQYVVDDNDITFLISSLIDVHV